MADGQTFQWCLMASLMLAVAGCATQAARGGSAAQADVATAPGSQVAGVASGASVIHVEHLDGPTPWTHLQAADAVDAFQFAIVSDRTGGVRPGVFGSAMTKLNLLQPEFVMSVGDLIQGYTVDVNRLHLEWDELDSMVGQLQSPFFYLPGNHDITNETMRQVWHERYGPSHYFFIYKGVLFLCLDTMDGGMHQVSQEQVDWVKGVLQNHQDVRWTLLFMHNPLWHDEATHEGPQRDISRWEQLEGLLAGRQYTAFAGHYHRYLKHTRGNRRLFTLATTGGGSSLRGLRYGEFDHVMWVTMTPTGPLLANVLLDGILDENVRTEELRQFQQLLFMSGNLDPEPIYFKKRFRQGESRVRLNNVGDRPLTVHLEVAPPEGVALQQPLPESWTIAPNSVGEQRLNLGSSPALTETRKVPIAWRARAAGEHRTLEFSGNTQVSLVAELDAPRHSAIQVDGQHRDWGRLEYLVATPAQIRGDAKVWHGVQDSSFRVGLRQDDQYLYVAVDVKDDEVRAVPDKPPWQQDGIELRIDARADPDRFRYIRPPDKRGIAVVALSPSTDVASTWLYELRGVEPVEGLLASCVRTPSGYRAEMAVPKLWMASQGATDGRVRINLAVDDADVDGQSQSWWFPDWRTGEQVFGSGTVPLMPAP